jgi:stage III sporulation protein SpoIIIAA
MDKSKIINLIKQVTNEEDLDSIQIQLTKQMEKNILAKHNEYFPNFPLSEEDINSKF